MLIVHWQPDVLIEYIYSLIPAIARPTLLMLESVVIKDLMTLPSYMTSSLWHNLKSSSPFAIVPSSFIISHITALGVFFDNFAISTEASVCPALTKTPPSSAGQYLTLVGEAGTSNQIVLKIKRPIQLR